MKGKCSTITCLILNNLKKKKKNVQGKIEELIIIYEFHLNSGRPTN